MDKHKDIAVKFIQQVEILQKSPYKNNLDIKPLKWQKSKYRLRIWKYMFLYEIIEDKILIFFFDVGSRWDIYK